MRFGWAVIFVVLAASTGRADVFTLKDGTTIEGALVGSTDDAYLVKLADGTTRKIAKDEVKQREAKPVGPATSAPATPATPVAAKPAELTAEERLVALKKAARDGLSLR